MNIGLDIRELQPDIMTGIGRYIINFLQWAIPANPDCRFYLYGNQKTKTDQLAENVILRIIPENWSLWWDQVILPQQLKEDRIDVFLSPYIKVPFFSCVPMVNTIHDLLFLVLPEYKKNTLEEAFYKLFAKLAASKAKSVITISAHSQADIVRLLKVPAVKIKVVPLSVAEKFYQPLDTGILDKIKQNLGIADDYILYVGNFKPHKNVAALIKAYSRLGANLKDKYQLLLCGKTGEYAQQLQQLIQSLGLEGRVIFSSMVIDEHMPTLYNGAELFVFPSLYEGFGLPVIEAMAGGTAVITSNSSSLPEVAGDCAMLVDPGNPAAMAEAIHTLLTDNSLRDTYITRGLNRAKQFNPEKTGTMILDLLRQATKT